MMLEDKLKINAPADDKLGIFKSQAAMLIKKKEQKGRRDEEVGVREAGTREDHDGEGE